MHLSHSRHGSRSLATLAVIVILVTACRSSIDAGPRATPTDVAGSVSVRPATTAAPTMATSFPSQSSSPTDGGAPPASAVDPRADGLDVVCDDATIVLETDQIRPGRVTLIVRNASRSMRRFELKPDRSGSGSDRDRNKIETRPVDVGEALRIDADLDSGRYDLECVGSDHAPDGMQTILVVRAGAPLVTPASVSDPAGSVRIVQYAFVAAALDVAAGSRVTWTNDDPAPHTITADDGSFDSRQLDARASFSVVLDTAGSFSYHCEIHPTMVGMVVVH